MNPIDILNLLVVYDCYQETISNYLNWNMEGCSMVMDLCKQVANYSQPCHVGMLCLCCNSLVEVLSDIVKCEQSKEIWTEMMARVEGSILQECQ